MSVYRMKFAPEMQVPKLTKGTKEYDSCRNEIFDMFIKNGFIGTGWDEVPLKSGMSEIEIRKVANQPKGSIENFRNICAIEKNDLIWVIHNSTYYLFKVSENKVGTAWLEKTFGNRKKWFVERDISKCFTGEWKKIGNELNVPGIVINNMGIGGTLRELKKASVLSMMIWNKATETKTYELSPLTEDDFWNLLTDRQIEGIVMAYIQVRFGCIVNTESLKHSTAIYECELINQQGIHYYPQVKTGSSGNREYPIEEYCAKIHSISRETGFTSVPVIFYENEDYGDYYVDGLIRIYRSDLISFIKENKNYISQSVLQAYGLIKNGEKKDVP